MCFKHVFVFGTRLYLRYTWKWFFLNDFFNVNTLMDYNAKKIPKWYINNKYIRQNIYAIINNSYIRLKAINIGLKIYN